MIVRFPFDNFEHLFRLPRLDDVMFENQNHRRLPVHLSIVFGVHHLSFAFRTSRPLLRLHPRAFRSKKHSTIVFAIMLLPHDGNEHITASAAPSDAMFFDWDDGDGAFSVNAPDMTMMDETGVSAKRMTEDDDNESEENQAIAALFNVQNFINLEDKEDEESGDNVPKIKKTRRPKKQSNMGR